MSTAPAQTTVHRAISGTGLPADSYRGTFTASDTRAYFAERTAKLRQGVLVQLALHQRCTATQLRGQIGAGMRELDRVLQQLRRDGAIQSRRRMWEIVP